MNDSAMTIPHREYQARSILSSQPSPAISKLRQGRRTGFFVAISFFLFIVISHLPVITDGVRESSMLGLALAGALFAAFGVKKIGFSALFTSMLLAILVLVAFGIHNAYHPALTEYASQKRILFWMVFPTCFLIWPLAIFAFDRDLKYSIQVLVAVSVLFALLAFVAPTGENIRRSGIELNPVLHAKLLFFPLFVLLAQTSRSKNRLLWIATLLLMVLACLKTGSRSPIAVAFVLLIMNAAFTDRAGAAKRLWLYGGLIAAAISVLLAYLPPEITERFSLESILNQSGEGDRLFLFRLAWDLLLANPNGIGMGNMSAFFRVAAPHNIFLEVLLDVGFFISAPFLFLLLYTCLLATKAFKSHSYPRRFLSIWFFFFFVQSLIGGEITFPSVLFYVPMGLLLLDRACSPSRRRVDKIGSSQVVGGTGGAHM